jgi:hypothetical protein
MTSLTAFDCRLGLSQGRMPRADDAPGAGDFVLVLGDLEPSRLYDLAPGDYAEVTQPVDVTAADLLRAALYLRVPADVPPGMAWEVSLVVDGAKLARAICRPGRARALTDLAANVSKLAGIHVVGVRLQLVGV